MVRAGASFLDLLCQKLPESLLLGAALNMLEANIEKAFFPSKYVTKHKKHTKTKISSLFLKGGGGGNTDGRDIPKPKMEVSLSIHSAFPSPLSNARVVMPDLSLT